MKVELTGSKINRGTSLIEILISVAILSLGISAAMLLVFANQSLQSDVEINNEALLEAQSMLENSRAQSREDFSQVNSIATTSADFYNKGLAVEEIDLFTKKITSYVSWPVMSPRPAYIKLSTLISNWQNPLNTCFSSLSGDWTAPAMHSYEFGKDLLDDSSSGFPIGDIDVFNGILYVVVNNSNGNNFPTFFIFDVTGTQVDPALKPQLIAQIDNNPDVKSGLNAVRIGGQYAYTATATNFNYMTCVSGVCGQLQAIDVSDADNPSAGVLFKIPGVTGKNGQAIGQTVFYKDGFVYIGLAKTATGPEFNIVDVGGGGGAASPANPVWVGGYSIGNGINAIFVKNDYAYIASANNTELQILDIGDKANPQAAGSYNAPDNQGSGKSIALAGTKLYLGRTLTSANAEFNILNNSNPASVLPLLGAKEISSSVNGLLIRDYLAFLLTNSQFQIWNIANPANIFAWASPIDLPGNSSGSTIECEGNNIFFGSVPSNDKGYIAIVSPGP